MTMFANNFDFNFKKGIIKKISYERRAYESVDEKSLYISLAMSQKKKRRKKILDD